MTYFTFKDKVSFYHRIVKADKYFGFFEFDVIQVFINTGILQ